MFFCCWCATRSDGEFPSSVCVRAYMILLRGKSILIVVTLARAFKTNALLIINIIKHFIVYFCGQ